MKNIYDLLNDTKVDTADYEVAPLNDLEKASIKQKFHRAAKLSMKRSPYRWAAIAACMVCVIGFSQTAYAQTVINGILQNISLGHNSVIQVDPTKEPASSAQFYDKDGKPITKMNGVTDIYDAKGNKLGSVAVGKKGSEAPGSTIEKDLNKAVSQLSFKPLLPKSLPVSYTFDHAALYPDEKDKVSGDYVDLFYTGNGKNIYIQERRISSATTYTDATDGTVEKLQVNGHDAALIDGKNIEWESGGVSVSISAQSLTRDELLALAKSFA